MISTLYEFPWNSPTLYTVLLTFEPQYVVLGFYLKLANTVTDHDPKDSKQDDSEEAEAAARNHSCTKGMGLRQALRSATALLLQHLSQSPCGRCCLSSLFELTLLTYYIDIYFVIKG